MNRLCSLGDDRRRGHGGFTAILLSAPRDTISHLTEAQKQCADEQLGLEASVLMPPAKRPRSLCSWHPRNSTGCGRGAGGTSRQSARPLPAQDRRGHEDKRVRSDTGSTGTLEHGDGTSSRLQGPSPVQLGARHRGLLGKHPHGHQQQPPEPRYSLLRLAVSLCSAGEDLIGSPGPQPLPEQ